MPAMTMQAVTLAVYELLGATAAGAGLAIGAVMVLVASGIQLVLTG